MSGMTYKAFSELSALQRNCVRLKAKGYSDLAIATDTGSTTGSVQSILCRIRAKFLCSGNDELVAKYNDMISRPADGTEF